MARMDRGFYTQVGARMSPEQLKFCEFIGAGNASQGVRLLVDKAMAEEGFTQMEPIDLMRSALFLLEQQQEPKQ